MRDYLTQTWLNYRLSFIQVYRFCIAGIIGLTSDMIITLSLRKIFEWDLRLCGFFGFLLGGFLNFLVNRTWVFENKSQQLLKDYFNFLLIAFMTLFVRLGIMSYLIESQFPLSDFIINFFGITLPAIISFFSMKYFVFKIKRPQ